MDTLEPAVNSQERASLSETHPLARLKSLRRFSFIARFALRTRRAQILIIGVTLLVLVTGLFLWPQLRPPSTPQVATPADWLSWQDNLQSIFGLATLLVAAFVWFGEVRQDWEQSLPKLLNVYFYHDGQPVIVCLHAYLAGEADIRQWGQQLGAQMAEERNLAFRPNLEAREPELILAAKGDARKRYHVRFHLTKLPAKLAAQVGHCLWRDMLRGPLDAVARPSEAVAVEPELRKWIEPLVK